MITYYSRTRTAHADGRKEKVSEPAEAGPLRLLAAAIKARHGQLENSCAGELEALRNGAQYNSDGQTYSLCGRQSDRACRFLFEESQPLPEKPPSPHSPLRWTICRIRVCCLFAW